MKGLNLDHFFLSVAAGVTVWAVTRFLDARARANG